MIDRNLMFASDNAVRDALIKRRLTNDDLKSLFISRGILVSKETNREDLSIYFSRLNHDFYDHQAIARVMGIVSGKEKSSVTYINSTFTKDEIESALNEVRDHQQNEGDTRKVTIRDKVFELTVEYKEIDYGKSEFSQVRNKDAIISISETDEGVSIRWPANEYVKKIKENLLDSLAKKYENVGNIQIEEIELSSIRDPKMRTNFFSRLINLVEGYIVNDVTDVFVYNPKEPEAGMDDDEIQAGENSNLGIHITKASLSGEGVLNSKELKSLYDKGFYISKIIWTAKTNAVDSNIYKFEAQFSNPEECKTFSYMVRGVYKYIKPRTYKKNRTNVDTLDDMRFSRLIEKAAKSALTEIRDIFAKGT
jgi:hypothetical protein